MPRILALLLVFVLLAGCRVQIVLPARGGYVVIAETELVVNRDNVDGIVIQVRDFDFDQTFYAIPEPGWVFSHWKTGPNTLCGGRSTPCRLETSSLRGKRGAEDILRSDDVYFLEPVFVRIGLPVTDQPYGGRCINSEIYAVGSVTETEYIERDLETGESYFLQYRQEMEQGVTEPALAWELTEGSNTLRTTVDVTNEQTGEFFRNEFSAVLRYVPQGFRLQNWGQYARSLDDRGETAFSLLTWFEPPYVERFGFREGRGSESSFLRMESGFDRGRPVGTRDVEVTKYRTFLGYATVNTMYGRHNTCHYQEEIHETIDGQTSVNKVNYFYRINDGILVFQDRADGRIERELIPPALINGRFIDSF